MLMTALILFPGAEVGTVGSCCPILCTVVIRDRKLVFDLIEFYFVTREGVPWKAP